MKLAVTYLKYCATVRASSDGVQPGASVINFRHGRSEVFFTDCDQNKRDVNANREVMWQSTTEHVDVTARVSWAQMLFSNNR